MKVKNQLMVAALVVSISTQVCLAALQAQLPEFKSKKDILKSSEVTRLSKKEQGVFFTGKLYEVEREGYVFKYRVYDPKLSRWTSADPSGFPDGANNKVYGGAPTGGVDALGLKWHFVGENSTASLSGSSLSYNVPVDLHGNVTGSYEITGFSNGKSTSLTMNITAENIVDGWLQTSTASLNSTITFNINETSGEVTMSGTTKDDNRGYKLSVGSVNAAYNLGIEDRTNVVQGAIAFGYLYNSGSATLSIGFKGSALEVGVEIPAGVNWSKDPTLSFALNKAE